LNQPSGRVEFIRHFYNLLSANSDEEANTSTTIAELNRKIANRNMMSMHTKEATKNNSRKRARTAGDGSEGGGGRGDRGGGGGSDDRQLRAHGYEVRPEDFVDDFGMLWQSLDKVSVTFSFYSPR
jgi:hypothetical protein